MSQSTILDLETEREAPWSYEEALAFVEGLGSSIQKLGLERMAYLMDTLGNPQDDLPTVHIAGSNGKGSVSAMLTSVLTATGYRVGTYTSPHLMDIRERIMLNGVMMPQADFASEVQALWGHLKALDLPEERWPTYFEFLNILAYQYFYHQRIEVAVIETGLGGRLDSTNVVKKPLVSVITGISLEHAHILGDTLGKIAAEKAGIIKLGCPVVVGPEMPQEALAVIQARALAQDASCRLTDNRQLRTLPESDLPRGLHVLDESSGQQYALGLAGLYQKNNLATVLGMIDELRAQGFEIPDSAVKTGLQQCRWPARCQYFKQTRVLLDGSHNMQGFDTLRESLDFYVPDQPIVWMLSLLSNRDPEPLLAWVTRDARTQGIILTAGHDAERFHDPVALCAYTRELLASLKHQPDKQNGLCSVWTAAEPDCVKALAQLKECAIAASGSIGVITGSLYTAGELLASGQLA